MNVLVVDVGGTTVKILAQRIILELEHTSEPQLGHDSSTNNLIRRYRTLKETL
jgi:glucose-6-phosphate isomerase